MNDHAFNRKLQTSGNFLLLRDDVGKAKPPIHRLPSPDFAYGKMCARDREGAGAVLSSWKIHRTTADSELGLDYLRLNVNSVAAGCTTAKQLNEFRSLNQVRRRSPTGRIRQSLPDFSFVHGVKGKPSTPIGDVVSNYYGRRAVDEKHQVYSRQTQGSPIELHVQAYKPSSANSPEKRDMFKMRKFRAVSSRIDSYANRLPTAMSKMRASSIEVNDRK